MKISIPTVAAFLLLGAAACETTTEDELSESANYDGGYDIQRQDRTDESSVQVREASAPVGAGYEREIETRGTVIDAVPFLLRGDGLASEPGLRVLAIETPEGIFLVLPPGVSSSDDNPADPDPAEAERLDFDLTTLRPGERVRLSGEVYRRGGMQGIEVESISRE